MSEGCEWFVCAVFFLTMPEMRADRGVGKHSVRLLVAESGRNLEFEADPHFEKNGFSSNLTQISLPHITAVNSHHTLYKCCEFTPYPWVPLVPTIFTPLSVNSHLVSVNSQQLHRLFTVTYFNLTHAITPDGPTARLRPLIFFCIEF